MPIVRITMLSGRDNDTKRLLLRNVTAAVTTTLKVAPDSVRVILDEVPEEHYGVAGLPIREHRSRQAQGAKRS
ncbi:MAG: 2-hydroxymuconate tautomerase family protein [Acidobacteria bacterium]|nr:2-hydroxymuconate tautomerase family protein [Acidobacteriota bacterium]